MVPMAPGRLILGVLSGLRRPPGLCQLDVAGQARCCWQSDLISGLQAL